MNPIGNRSTLLFDWTRTPGNRRRLTLWIIVAFLLHVSSYLLFRVTYPSPTLTRITDTTLYVVPPSSSQAQKIAPFLNAADPALFAPENTHGHDSLLPAIPPYQPSYAIPTTQLLLLPDSSVRILPPLIRNLGPVPIPENIVIHPIPAPTTKTQIVFSNSLQARSPQDWPQKQFVARPGDQLAPARFYLAVAPDGRTLHVVKDTGSSNRIFGTDNQTLDEEVSRYLMKLRFQRGLDAKITWGTAAFYWGLDVKREELR